LPLDRRQPERWQHRSSGGSVGHRQLELHLAPDLDGTRLDMGVKLGNGLGLPRPAVGQPWTHYQR
jgi:hypothetical protein